MNGHFKGRIPARRSWSTRFAAAVRWLHIYVSLLGFTALVFFAVTGITLNHPDWFGTGNQVVKQYKGEVKKSWVVFQATDETSNSSASASEEEQPSASDNSEQTESATESPDAVKEDRSQEVEKFEIVEFLRQTHRIRGAVSEFRVDDYECLILFKGPGYAADTVIDRESGRYTITETLMGAIAIINDLHKGRDSGPVWFWVIDISALLMIFVSITGIILIFYLKRKRWSGTITAVVGTIVFAALYFWCP